ncbi:MAG TPA: TIR domain-containing protein [Herbaspirillum sp.]|uniref:TIR domain-containing protein n=1 Tax=Herbaspirillum sp. TaxID=1890675 RepID=UPI002D5187BB|nr:TIR domain-containing protein [Herbaspirillum sp.]HZG18850.1 TIR domain-containing protein [Herbaspirillum sp.]
MLERYQGEAGRRRTIEALLDQRIVVGNRELAEQLYDRAELLQVNRGEKLIEQGAYDSDVYFILAGSLGIDVNGRQIAARMAGNSVGEMSVLDPTNPRAATVFGLEHTVVAKVSEPHISELANQFPVIYRLFAKELARRLFQRNSLINEKRDRIRVFVISSVESLPIVRAMENHFAHDEFLPVVWTNGVFKIANYTLQSLEDQLDRCDFAIAVAHADDTAAYRGKDWPVPRDNVIFELGLFMGRLGKDRAILMEPRDHGVKLPSDLSGITTVPYRYEPGEDMAALIAPACNQIRDHIKRLGSNVG